jgi:DNA helicase-2/ATP-dependent DNA helicase PcrA
MGALDRERTARAEAEEIYRDLQRHVSCHLIVRPDTSFPRGVSVLPSYLAKGLEFDAAFVVNSDPWYHGDEERNLFYTVCTRALHRLFIYTSGQLPEYFESIPEAMYEIIPEKKNKA